jgi:outer membrane receptor protein involved in Fe transport
MIAVALMLCSTPVAGQAVFGTISGVVTDPSGAVIPGAAVKVTNLNTGVSKTLITNGAGAYNAASLPPGTYEVQVDLKGFKTAVAKDITVEVSGNARVDLKLEIGQTTESVEVTSEAPLLQTQQSSIGQTVSQKQLDMLPVQGGTGRSIYNLVALSAGVTQQVGQGYDLDNMRINGGRPRMDDYLLDGTSTQQPVWGGPAVTPSVEAIQEFRVETNAFSAEYGKVSGGIMTAVTRSGTNSFHGAVYEFLRNDKLNATPFFADKKPPLRYNEFGARFGGPVFKNKLFFFADYQGVRSSTSTPSPYNAVPNAAFRAGNLSALLPGTQLHDPLGNPYVNNQVPVSAIAQKLLALFPTGNGGANPNMAGSDYFNTNTSSRETVNRINARIDWNPNQADRIFSVFHIQRERNPLTTAYGGAVAGSSYQTNDANGLTVGWTHTFSSTLVNDFRFGYTHRNVLRTDNGYGISDPVDFGITGIPACKLQQSGGKCGAPSLSISGYPADIGGGLNMMIEPAGNKQFTDTLSKVVGRHSFKFGGEIRRYSIDNIQPNRLTGEFIFNGAGTGNPFADFLIGYLGNSRVDQQSQFLSSRAWSNAFFVQDDWKVTPRLTLNLGLRWQYDPSFHEINHQTASFNPHTLTWERFGVNGVPEGAIDTHWKQFGPRVGFAWNMFGNFVLRGGYGISYPGFLGHGRAGDAEPSPNLLTQTHIAPGTYLSTLPPIAVPDPNAPLTLGQASYVMYIPRKQPATYVQQWNLTLEKQLARDMIASLAYTGSHGVHLPVQYSYNLCQASRAQVTQYGWGALNMDSPYCAPGSLAALGGVYGAYIYPGWTAISSSVYHALSAKIEKRYSNGFGLLGSFTWSKLIDDSSSDWSGFGSLDSQGTDFYDRKYERSVSAGDVPLRFVVSPIYELPWGRGKRWLNEGPLSQVLGGWRVTGIYTISSGEPLGINDAGYQYCNPARIINVRPMVVGNPLPSGFQRTADYWFDTSAFDWSGTCVASSPRLVQLHGAANASYTFGDAPRFFSNLRGPRYNNIDASLQKEFRVPLGEQGRLRFQMDAFNLLNHTLLSNPGVIADANFGKITSTRIPGRTMQLGLHLSF